MATNRGISEHKEQVAVVTALRRGGYLVFAIPNGGQRGKLEGMNMKREGLMAGVPDLCICLPGGKVVWLELKRRNSGRLSAAQKEVHATMEQMGHTVIVAHGAKDAMQKLYTAIQ